MEFMIVYSIDGYGTAYIEADSEEEAEAMFNDGDWSSSREDVGYYFESAEAVVPKKSPPKADDPSVLAAPYLFTV